MKQYIPLCCIIFLAAVFRFTYLDRIPTAISGDELHYILTAKSVWLTGHDITGTWNPLSVFFFRYPPNEQQAELPYFLHIPFSGPFPFSLFLAKLPFAVLSIGIVLLLYGIARKLFGKTAGIATGLIAAVSPWLVVMGRTGYESTPATFFYLLAIRVLLTTRSWGILWSLIPFILAFYSYIGTKLIFIPFIILSIILTYRRQKQSATFPYVVLVLTCLLFTAGYFILVRTTPTGSRISEILLPSSPAVVSRVNEIRKTSIQSPLVPVLFNKYTAYIHIIVSKLFRIFSPSYLFAEGDQFFLPAKQSFFYYADLLLMIWGTFYLFIQKRKYFIILSGFIFVGILPHLLHSTMGDFSIHLSLMFPFLILICGTGAADFMHLMKGYVGRIILGIAAVVYMLNVANFLTVYLLQYPLMGAGDFPMRILTRYVTLARKADNPVTIYSTRKADLFTKYLFYSNAITKETLAQLGRLHTKQPFTFQKINFSDCDFAVTGGNAPPGVLITDQNCSMNIESPAVSISSLLDGGQQYKIFHDPVCSGYALSPYPAGVTLNDFDIYQLSEQRFCMLYITK